jgi:hypothetical protein
MRFRYLIALPVLWAFVPAAAGDLAAPTLAKFIRVLVQSTGNKSIACTNKELATELESLGVGIDPLAKLVWVDSDKELARHAKGGRIVLCDSRALLAGGACLAVIAEGGRPAIYVSPRSLAAAGATLPDNIMKIAKVAQ